MKKFKIKTRPSEEIMMAINGELDDKLISEKMKKMLEAMGIIIVYSMAIPIYLSFTKKKTAKKNLQNWFKS